jgi:hypothetical protein
VPILNVNMGMHRTITALCAYGFFQLDVQQRIGVMLHLTTEMLGTAHCRDIMNSNLIETDVLDQANKEETERRAKEELDWAKDKAKRAPTAYNLYLQTELGKCKEQDPDMLHKDAFSMSAANWKALGDDQVPTPVETSFDKWTQSQRETVCLEISLSDALVVRSR